MQQNGSQKTTVLNVDATKEPVQPSTRLTPEPILEPPLPVLEPAILTRVSTTALDAGEFSSPAFIKRARVSYGSLLDDGIRLFEEDDGTVPGRGRKRARFSMGSRAWRYSSRSPSPEIGAPEVDPDDALVEEETTKQTAAPVMTDEGCQTDDFEDFRASVALASSAPQATAVVGEPRRMEEMFSEPHEFVASRTPDQTNGTDTIQFPASPLLLPVPSAGLPSISPLLARNQLQPSLITQEPQLHGWESHIENASALTSTAEATEELYGASSGLENSQEDMAVTSFAGLQAMAEAAHLNDQYGHWQAEHMNSMSHSPYPQETDDQSASHMIQNNLENVEAEQYYADETAQAYDAPDSKKYSYPDVEDSLRGWGPDVVNSLYPYNSTHRPLQQQSQMESDSVPYPSKQVDRNAARAQISDQGTRSPSRSPRKTPVRQLSEPVDLTEESDENNEDDLADNMIADPGTFVHTKRTQPASDEDANEGELLDGDEDAEGTEYAEEEGSDVQEEEGGDESADESEVYDRGPRLLSGLRSDPALDEYEDEDEAEDVADSDEIEDEEEDNEDSYEDELPRVYGNADYDSADNEMVEEDDEEDEEEEYDRTQENVNNLPTESVVIDLLSDSEDDNAPQARREGSPHPNYGYKQPLADSDEEDAEMTYDRHEDVDQTQDDAQEFNGSGALGCEDERTEDMEVEEDDIEQDNSEHSEVSEQVAEDAITVAEPDQVPVQARPIEQESTVSGVNEQNDIREERSQEHPAVEPPGMPPSSEEVEIPADAPLDARLGQEGSGDSVEQSNKVVPPGEDDSQLTRTPFIDQADRSPSFSQKPVVALGSPVGGYDGTRDAREPSAVPSDYHDTVMTQEAVDGDSPAGNAMMTINPPAQVYEGGRTDDQAFHQSPTPDEDDTEQLLFTREASFYSTMEEPADRPSRQASPTEERPQSSTNSRTSPKITRNMAILPTLHEEALLSSPEGEADATFNKRALADTIGEEAESVADNSVSTPINKGHLTSSDANSTDAAGQVEDTDASATHVKEPPVSTLRRSARSRSSVPRDSDDHIEMATTMQTTAEVTSNGLETLTTAKSERLTRSSAKLVSTESSAMTEPATENKQILATVEDEAPTTLRVTRASKKALENLESTSVILSTTLRPSQRRTSNRLASLSPALFIDDTVQAPGQDATEEFALAALNSPTKTSYSPSSANRMSVQRQLSKDLKTNLPGFTELKAIRFVRDKKADILAVATTASAEPERAKRYPKDWHTHFKMTDNSTPGQVFNVAIFRPHKEALPVIEPGNGVLLRRMEIRPEKPSFAFRSNDESAWVVFLDHGLREETRGPPVEYGDLERDHVQRLRKWYGMLDDVAAAKIEKANQVKGSAV